jgi:pyruvate/2-oxoglutarate dehydrogenase complex dihydrolipoamide dehydrogenase (E3) component
MTDQFDVIVIGAGPPGQVAAGRCADGGLAVALVERELVGGECSYWACVPSKTLIRPGDVLAAARRVPGAAEAVTGQLDAAAAFAQRDYMTSSWNDQGALAWVEDEGIELVRGTGRLTGERAVQAELRDGGRRELTARRAVVLATGSAPQIPPVPGLAEARPWDNRGATAATEVPGRLVVLGGGPVGCELAQAFRRLGSQEVTVVVRGGRLLAREEPFASDEVKAAFEAEGIDVRTRTGIAAVRRDRPGGPVTVTLAEGPASGDGPGDGGPPAVGQELVADELLVAAGRRPRTGDLGLDRVGLEPGAPARVDRHLRVEGAAGGWLFAVGDCNGLAPLTHMGKYQGRLAGDVILGRDVTDLADHGVVPRVTFTDPQVCAVGPTEAEARRSGLDLRVVTTATGGVAGAYVQGNGIDGTSQLLVDQAGRVVVGATFTGPGTQELLHSATIAVAGEVPLDRLWHAVPSFPTVSEVWLRLLEAYGL